MVCIANFGIHFSYKKAEFHWIDTSNCDWVKRNAELAVPKDKLIKKVHALLDKEEKSFINSISGLKADGKYYIQTEDDDVLTFIPEMEEFFKALKGQRKRSDISCFNYGSD